MPHQENILDSFDSLIIIVESSSRTTTEETTGTAILHQRHHHHHQSHCHHHQVASINSKKRRAIRNYPPNQSNNKKKFPYHTATSEKKKTFSIFLFHTTLPFLFLILFLCDSSRSTSIKLKSETNTNIHRRRIDNTTYQAVIDGEIALPCNITAPSFDDGASLVLWYRDDIATPIYTVDARQSISLAKAQHFLHMDIFDRRATFNISYPLSFLRIKPVRSSDGGDYRCRVDFRRARTVNRILKLTVIVPATSVVIYDQNFTIIDQVAGPFVEGTNQSLICDSSQGNPLPVVHWWRGTRLIDTEYFIVNNTISRNVLLLASVGRQDLQQSFTCQAYNTNLTAPISKTITLDLYLKPKEIRIITQSNNNISSVDGAGPTTATMAASVIGGHQPNHPIELACQCSGSKPPANIRWMKNSTNSAAVTYLDAFSEIVSNDGLTTTSFLSFVPSIEDNGKTIACIGYNPNISDERAAISDIWPIDINYAPILSLVMGSDSRSSDILEGNNVYFECDIKANPPVTVFGWKLNGETLDAAGTATAPTMATTIKAKTKLPGIELRNTSLLVTNVNHDHYGHYQCYAGNRLGLSQSESVFLNVKYTPRCMHHYQNPIPIGVALMESVTIECQVLANPTDVIFEWWRSAASMEIPVVNNINTTQAINFTSHGTRSVAKYTAYSMSAYGYVYCRARNMVGRQDKPCVFHIIKAEAPSHPHNCSLVNKTAHSLTVECLPGYSGGLNQTFHLQVYSLNPNRLLKNLSNGDQPYFPIDDLPAGYIFKLVIYAANRKGVSKPIEITGSTTEPSPWKSADFSGSNDLVSGNSSPLVLVIISVIVLLLVLIVLIFVYLRNRIKGRMRTVVQASDKPAANVTPKSIMKKHKSCPIGNTNITLENIKCGPNQDHNDLQQQQQQPQPIEINDLTTFKPDYHHHHHHHNTVVASSPGTRVGFDGDYPTGGSHLTTTDTGTISSNCSSYQQHHQPYYVPSDYIPLPGTMNQQHQTSNLDIDSSFSGVGIPNFQCFHQTFIDHHHQQQPTGSELSSSELSSLSPYELMLCNQHQQHQQQQHAQIVSNQEPEETTTTTIVSGEIH